MIGKTAWKIEPAPHRLAGTIRAKLLAVAPEDQDVVLEDSDWRLILSALDGAPTVERPSFERHRRS